MYILLFFCGTFIIYRYVYVRIYFIIQSGYRERAGFRKKGDLGLKIYKHIDEKLFVCMLSIRFLSLVLHLHPTELHTKCVLPRRHFTGDITGTLPSDQ